MSATQSPAEPTLDLVLLAMEPWLEFLVQTVQEARAAIQEAREQGKLSEDSATARRVFGFGEFLGTLDTAWRKYKTDSFDPPPGSPPVN